MKNELHFHMSTLSDSTSHAMHGTYICEGYAHFQCFSLIALLNVYVRSCTYHYYRCLENSHSVVVNLCLETLGAFTRHV